MVTENEGAKKTWKIWVEFWANLSKSGGNKALAYEASTIVDVLQTD